MRRALLLVFVLGFAATSLTAAERTPVLRAEIPVVGEIGGPVPGLDAAQQARWLAGREIFDRDFHVADGLGMPDYNGDSCRACHQDPAMGGAGGLELNVSRFADDNGGSGPFTILPGGPVLHKFRVPGSGDREEYDPADADVFEQRQSPALFGAGLIDSIPDAVIRANEDPTDGDADDIYGVARLVDVGGVEPEVGRFGWKAQVPRLGDFARDALGVECGVTTPPDGRGFALASDGIAPNDPELSLAEVDDLTFFMQNLGAPPRGGSADPAVAQGELLFGQIGCAVCHVPSLDDDQGQPVFLYSNLLLHDVMPVGFRGLVEDGAGAGVFRTPPLWGVRHSAPYMHDGRAETLRDAVLAHFGEADAVRAAFLALPGADQTALIRFLEDL